MIGNHKPCLANGSAKLILETHNLCIGMQHMMRKEKQDLEVKMLNTKTYLDIQ